MASAAAEALAAAAPRASAAAEPWPLSTPLASAAPTAEPAWASSVSRSPGCPSRRRETTLRRGRRRTSPRPRMWEASAEPPPTATSSAAPSATSFPPAASGAAPTSARASAWGPESQRVAAVLAAVGEPQAWGPPRASAAASEASRRPAAPASAHPSKPATALAAPSHAAPAPSAYAARPAPPRAPARPCACSRLRPTRTGCRCGAPAIGPPNHSWRPSKNASRSSASWGCASPRGRANHPWCCGKTLRPPARALGVPSNAWMQASGSSCRFPTNPGTSRPVGTWSRYTKPWTRTGGCTWPRSHSPRSCARAQMARPIRARRGIASWACGGAWASSGR
mmetsp:Transcript_5457/g.17153  ORF Transcript_5457/g.17153 Transcript_5457/m.17153 type:complete len:338 (-) Transcript_5457:273-1286(-)